MIRVRIDRLSEALSPKAVGRIVLPTSEGGRHRMLLDSLQVLVDLTLEAFGPADPMADSKYLRTLSYHQLLDVYDEAMTTLVRRNNENGKLDWFKALPLVEQVRLCRNRDEEEMQRLRQHYEATRKGVVT